MATRTSRGWMLADHGRTAAAIAHANNPPQKQLYSHSGTDPQSPHVAAWSRPPAAHTRSSAPPRYDAWQEPCPASALRLKQWYATAMAAPAVAVGRRGLLANCVVICQHLACRHDCTDSASALDDGLGGGSFCKCAILQAGPATTAACRWRRHRPGTNPTSASSACSAAPSRVPPVRQGCLCAEAGSGACVVGGQMPRRLSCPHWTTVAPPRH